MKEDLQRRRAEVAEELSLPLDKVTIYPYKEPKGTIYPTPWQIKYAQEFIETGAWMICSRYNTVTRDRLEEIIECLKK